jgi:hypothetical protein
VLFAVLYALGKSGTGPLAIELALRREDGHPLSTLVVEQSAHRAVCAIEQRFGLAFGRGCCRNKVLERCVANSSLYRCSHVGSVHQEHRNDAADAVCPVHGDQQLQFRRQSRSGPASQLQILV